MKKLIRTAAFAAGGALAGLAYYYVIGCSGSCMITANPLRSALYLGVVGLLLAAATEPKKKEAS